VRTYVDAARGDDSSQEQEALRWLCSALERLLDGQLDGRDGWKGWVDGVLPALDMVPEAVTVISAVEVSVRGCAVWRKVAGGPCWIEPFFGIVRISEKGDSIAGYKLHFADAGRGLSRFPYGKHVRRTDWFFPPEWLMTFSDGAFTEGRLQ
jgi:hypothetical protein